MERRRSGAAADGGRWAGAAADGGRRAGVTGRGARRLVLLGAVLVLLLLGGAAPASAHAALRGSDPEDGSVVASAPRHVTLTFTESVGLLEDSFRVYGPDNRRVSLGEPRHADGASDTARVGLPGGLAEGTYTVAWRVVSADSHPVSGAFTFSVGKPSPTAPAVPAERAGHPVTTSLYDTARHLAYIAAALLIGTAAFAALCRPPDPAPLRLPLLTGWWTLLTATVVLLVLRAPYEAGTAPGTALDASAAARTLAGRRGSAPPTAGCSARRAGRSTTRRPPRRETVPRSTAAAPRRPAVPPGTSRCRPGPGRSTNRCPRGCRPWDAVTRRAAPQTGRRQPRAWRSSWHACSHERQASAHRRQCSCRSACREHSSAQALQAVAHAVRIARVTLAS
ncbi:hypothetical protein SGRIM128S_00979 [Streptomyces griseomycini]